MNLKNYVNSGDIMETVIYKKTTGEFGGEITIPPSKSAAHRAILCAALSQGKCELSNIVFSDDIRVTAKAVEALGGQIIFNENEHKLVIDCQNFNAKKALIDCHESGSTLRFLIPIAAALGVNATFIGSGRLPERPLDIYHNILPSSGVTLVPEKGLPLTISGKLKSGEFILPGNVSSQFITGLMLALPLLDNDSKITLLSPLESEGYVNLTVSIMKDFGVIVESIENGWLIKGNQKYKAQNYFIEGDWSQVAFFLSISALSGKKIHIKGLNLNSVQGDKLCIEEYRKFGLNIIENQNEGSVYAENPNSSMPFRGLTATHIDASQIPDLVPALSVCAAGCKGETVIYNAERLRIKECDRLLAMANAINALGGNAIVNEDGLKITGKEKLTGGNALGMNDHRVLMALSAAVFMSEGNIEVTDALSINKSYPNFYEDYVKLGGIADVVNMG